jgi:hypothetical protein
MRVVELSDHPGELLGQFRVARESAQQKEQQKEQARYEAELARHRSRVGKLRRAAGRARAEHRWLDWLRQGLAAWREQRRAPRRPVPAAAAGAVSDQEAILAAGKAGEDLVARQLGRALDDEWTLIRGYRNRRGEIDHVLLGPRGVVAIEVKFRNATVRCDGDEWRFDKYDNYGNLVEQGAMTDARGRSPSVQLNEPASLLENLLQQVAPVRVHRVVLLTHPRSRIGPCRNATVRLGTSADFVLDLVRKSRARLSAEQLAQAREIIQRDHQPGRSARGGTGQAPRRTR